MKYRAYSEYKDSCVEWLGEIPAGWTLEKFKYLFQVSNEKNGGEPVGQMLSVSGYRGVEIKEYNDEAKKRTLEEVAEYRVVRRGQLVVNTMWLNYSGLGVSEYEGYVSPAYRAYFLTEHVNKRYIHHLLRSAAYVMAYTAQMQGIRPNSLQIKTDDFQSLPILLPSIIEQEYIASFLDYELSKIDRLIRKQERLIELLKEKRQAVISHAVTKGLNSDVEMKYSGVEWLGNIPKHWIVRRLKHTATLQSGIPKGKDLTGKKTISVPMLRVANVQDGYFNLDDIHMIDIEPHELPRYALKKGDVLMNEGGDNDQLGRGAVWNDEIRPCIHQNHVFSIRTIDIEPEWLDVLTRASYAKFYFYSVAKQSTNLASVSSSNIKETPLLIPPKKERIHILDYIFDKVKKFDLLTLRAERQILLLKERRSALISAAVTGKIDVRNWQPDAMDAA